MSIIYRNPDLVPLVPFEADIISKGNIPAIINEIRNKDGIIHLWTFVPRGLWLRFYRKGVIRTDSSHVYHVIKKHGVVDACFWLESYNWMMEQMSKRLANYKGRYPIWAYYMPHPGEFDDVDNHKFVRIEFCVPISRVLLSCYANFHIVLNRYFLSLCEEEANYWEQFGEIQPYLVVEAVKRKLWERIFDFDLLALHSDFMVGESWEIQATLEEIYLNEVVEVVSFDVS